MKKRIVIALGGNAFGNNLQEQMTAAKITAATIVDLVQEGNEIVVVHGNGPQVGMIETAFETAAMANGHSPILPMPVCVALSQSYIGYDLQNTIRMELDKRKMRQQVAAIITQVEVDPADEAFENPIKPIGGFMSKDEAEAVKAKGIPVTEDAGRGWRQLVASPKPLNIIEADIIKTMLTAGQIPIAAGGGGIPVAVMPDGQYQGVNAVIDKDFSAACLAVLVGADMLVILTTVEKVAINFSKYNQKWLDTLTVEEAEKYIAEDQFAKGSMLPKVQAAIEFIKSSPVRMDSHEAPTALITLLTKAKDAITGKTGTKII